MAVIRAKYGGTCERCARPFAAGDRIHWTPGTRWNPWPAYRVRCTRADCHAVAVEALTATVTRLVVAHCAREGLPVRPEDLDPTRRGSLAWLFAPTLSRLSAAATP